MENSIFLNMVNFFNQIVIDNNSEKTINTDKCNLALTDDYPIFKDSYYEGKDDLDNIVDVESSIDNGRLKIRFNKNSEQ